MKSNSKGIYSKLKDPLVTWNEKLSLARFALDSSDCIIPNKQQVLIDWIIQELINGTKKILSWSTDCEEFTGLWKLLLHFLQSQQIVLEAKIPVTLKPQLLQVFTDIFLCKELVCKESFIDVVINCCHTVVSNPQLASCLLAKFETYVSFLSALLCSFVPICCDPLKEIHHLVELCLEKYLLVQRQQANQRKVFTAMCQQLLVPLTNLCHMLKVHVAQHRSQLDDLQLKKAHHISQLVELAITRSLFHKDHLLEYQQALKGVKEEKQTETEEPASKKLKISSYPKQLFDKLWEMSLDSVKAVNIPGTKKDVRKEASLEILPFLYKEFIISCRKMHPPTSAADFDFFTEICEIMGVLSGRCHSSDCILLHRLLECILLHDIYQVADDNTKGSLQFHWFEKLVEVLIYKAELSEAVFRCLDVLMKLNHSLLEPHLEIIWKMLWKGGHVTEVARNSLMSSLILIYVKLRQFEKLVVAILASLRTLNLSSFGLTTLFKQRFTKAIQGLPFGQIASIWNIFLEEIKENYVRSVNEQVLSKKNPKKKSSSYALVVYRNLEYVTSLFNLFIVNISFGGIGEQLKTKPFVVSVEKLLHQTVQDLLKSLVELASREGHPTGKESACFSVLLLQYSLGELELFLKKFKLIKKDAEETKLLPSVVWCDEISDFLPAMTKEKTICKDEGRLLYLKTALCIQNIRYVLLKKSESEQETKLCELRKLVSFVCSSITADEALCCTPWDREELSINKENAPVALWELISRHAVVLLPLCTADQQLIMAHLLIKTIAQETQVVRQAKPGCVTMYDISTAMIQSTAFHEMPSMQTSTVCALWDEFRQALGSKCAPNSYEGRLSKVLCNIASVELSTGGNENQVGTFRETLEDDTTIDENYDDDERMEEEEEDEEADDVYKVEDSPNEDNDDEDETGKETETSGTQSVASLQAFHALGCELTDISKSVLLAEGPVVNLSAAEPYVVLKILGYLPLDWLSNNNHVRCLIGLFTCDMLFNSVVLQECSPDLLKPLLWSRQLLTVLFDGCVSGRRFISHHVVDVESIHTWLVGSATKLWQKYHAEKTTESLMHDLLSVTRKLVYSTFKYLLRAPSHTTYVGQSIIQKLQSDLKAFTTEVQQCSSHSLKISVSSYHAISVLVQGILAVCEEAVTNKTSSSKMIRISSDVVIKLGPTFLDLLRAIVAAAQRKQNGKKVQNVGKELESNWHNILLQFPVLVDSFTALLHIYSVSEQSRKLLRVNKEYKQCEWQEVFDVLLTAVIHHLFEQNFTSLPLFFNEVGSLHSCLRFLNVVCQSCCILKLTLPRDFHIRLLASTLHFLKTYERSKGTFTDALRNDDLQSENENNGIQIEMLGTMTVDKINDSDSIAEEGYDLVVSLLEGCNLALLPELLEGLCGEITTQNSTESLFDRLSVSLHVWLRLLSGRFTKDRKKELRPKLPKVLFALQFLLQQFKGKNVRIVHMAIDVMVKILSLGKGMVLPHNALLVLHSSLNFLPHNDSFPQLFESQYSLLSTLLFQHSEAVYGAVHVFITCVRNLVLSLLKGCGECEEAPLENDGSQTNAAKFKPHELIQSAQRIARLYQEISSHKSTFSKYSPYMIADYIQSVQTVALPSVIRDALVPGVYCLLDMCGEHELSLLHAVLQKGSRELFHSLHADYTKYHKFKGKV